VYREAIWRRSRNPKGETGIQMLGPGGPEQAAARGMEFHILKISSEMLF
jgi:hypothetical protein